MMTLAEFLALEPHPVMEWHCLHCDHTTTVAQERVCKGAYFSPHPSCPRCETDLEMGARRL